MSALRCAEHLNNFEIWDLHSFLADEHTADPMVQSEEVFTEPFFRSESDEELANKVRASANIHVVSRTTGLLNEVEIDERGLRFRITTHGEGEARGSLLPIESIWAAPDELGIGS